MLSICMIIKNEERLLEKCLASATKLDAELVIVDTGSTDSSKEIAAKYTSNIYDYTWTGDFAAARNFAVSKATGSCILAIDADEILDKYNISTLKNAIEKCTNDTVSFPPLGHILCKSIFMNNGEENIREEKLPRLFSKEHYHYEGIIHEQLVPNNESVAKHYIETSLEFDHFGYYGDDDFLENKTNRNIELLNKMLDANPDDTYIMYQIGKSHYMRKDYDAAREIFDKCLYHDLDPRLEYVQDLVESYGYTLLNTERYEAALGLEGVYNEFSTSCEFIFLMGLIYMNNGLFDKAVKEFRKCTTFKTCKIHGTNSYRANYNIGVINECTGNIKIAKNFYYKCKNYAPAASRLKNL
ncbi:MAG: glycosyltransferase [Lachnospiraceae bacterium]|nr:glycosyltransferase [Lachnospiraceae bacterium]